VAEAVDEYLAQRYGVESKTAHVKHVRAVLDRLAEVTGSIPVRLLSRRQIEQWLATREDVAAVTRRGELSMVRSFCAWLHEQGSVPRDPCVRVGLPADLADFKAQPRRKGGQVGGDLRYQLLARGLAPLTVNSYYRVIVDAERFCEDRGCTLTTASLEVVAKYVAARPATFSTRKLVRDSLRHYWEITGRRDPPLGLIRVPPRPRMVCRALAPADAARLATVARARGDQAGLAVILGLYQGLRRTEIATLRWDNFDDEGWLTVTGKGGLVARLPVNPIVAALLIKRVPAGPYLFPGPKGGAVTPMCIWNWVRRVSEDAGVEGVTVHRLRHTCLATANDSVGDLRSVQEFARHADPRTTAGYTRTTERRLVAVMEAVNYEDANLDACQDHDLLSHGCGSRSGAGG
jgi:integrase